MLSRPFWRRAADRYAQRVASARDVRLWDNTLRQQIYLGDEVFVESMQNLADPQRAAAREIPKARRRTMRSLAQWRSACDSREKALFRAHTESGLTMNVIANLIESGLDARDQEKKRFFEFADRLSRSRDPEEQKRLKEELARMTFGE